MYGMPEVAPIDNVKERSRPVKLPVHLPIFSLSGASSRQLRSFRKLVVPLLVAEGLLVATVRCSPDYDEKDGDGNTALTVTVDNGQRLCVWRGDRAGLGLMLQRLAREVDLVLLETEPDTKLRTITLRQPGAADDEYLEVFGFKNDPAGAAAMIGDCLRRLLPRRPVWACILIGGKSSRMGQPKHLLTDNSGITWLERTVGLVQPLVDGVVLSGSGEVPASLRALPRLADIPGVGGPLTGILSAMRWQPEVAWLLLACDMPGLSTEAVKWLLAQQAAGCWGTIPQISPESAIEPLFARYEPQCAELFEQLNIQGVRRISRIAETNRVQVVRVPEQLRSGWRNVNTPEELLLFNDPMPGSC